MKKLVLLMVLLCSISFSQEQINPYAVALSRSLSKDLFDSNGVDIMQPSVEVLNATSNSRFFYTANVKDDDKVHFRFGVHLMTGVVPASFKTFQPHLPTEPFSEEEIFEYVEVDLINQEISSIDTLGLANYLFKTLLYDGQQSGDVTVPDESATLLGKPNGENIEIAPGSLERLAQERFESIKDQIQAAFPNVDLTQIEDAEAFITDILSAIPPTFELTQGGNINSVFAGVPQLDIMYKAFEVNLRYIPQLDYGDEFGKFGFFGFGVKHMFSKWFYEEESPHNFRMAIQLAYQSTSLENTVGETNAELSSDAQIFNVNLHGSQMIKNWFEVFAGLSYEYIDIETNYVYTLSIQLQVALGLVDENKNVSPPEYPGDTMPQTANIPITDENIKLTLGASRSIGPVDIFAAYSISQFNIFSFGVAANF